MKCDKSNIAPNKSDDHEQKKNQAFLLKLKSSWAKILEVYILRGHQFNNGTGNLNTNDEWLLMVSYTHCLLFLKSMFLNAELYNSSFR